MKLAVRNELNMVVIEVNGDDYAVIDNATIDDIDIVKVRDWVKEVYDGKPFDVCRLKASNFKLDPPTLDNETIAAKIKTDMETRLRINSAYFKVWSHRLNTADKVILYKFLDIAENYGLIVFTEITPNGKDFFILKEKILGEDV